VSSSGAREIWTCLAKKEPWQAGPYRLARDKHQCCQSLYTTKSNRLDGYVISVLVCYHRLLLSRFASQSLVMLLFFDNNVCDLNAVNNWKLPRIPFLSLAHFCYCLLPGKGGKDHRKKWRFWSFVKEIVWHYKNIEDCSQAWKFAANFADYPGKLKIFPNKPVSNCMGRVMDAHKSNVGARVEI